jgi:hypothetical protein
MQHPGVLNNHQMKGPKLMKNFVSILFLSTGIKNLYQHILFYYNLLREGKATEA